MASVIDQFQMMTLPSTGWMATGSQTVTDVLSLVGKGPTNIFPGGLRPTVTPSLLMGCIVPTTDLRKTGGTTVYL